MRKMIRIGCSDPNCWWHYDLTPEEFEEEEKHWKKNYYDLYRTCGHCSKPIKIAEINTIDLYCNNVIVLKMYPRICAHLICESLGYFTPQAAANALKHFKAGVPFFCEWYTHMAGGFNDEKVKEVGEKTLKRAIKMRKDHKGYMADYGLARKIIGESIKGNDPLFASWF